MQQSVNRPSIIYLQKIELENGFTFNPKIRAYRYTYEYVVVLNIISEDKCTGLLRF